MSDWISIHEQEPPKINDHQSIDLIWCNAEKPQYGQRIGKFSYAHKVFSDADSWSFIEDVVNNRLIDIYWKPLDEIPKPVVR